MIRITSKQHNFRRCRVAHPKGTTEYPDDAFTPEQIKVMQAEPKLIVEIVEEDKETETPVSDGGPPDGGRPTEHNAGELDEGDNVEPPVKKKSGKKRKR